MEAPKDAQLILLPSFAVAFLVLHALGTSSPGQHWHAEPAAPQDQSGQKRGPIQDLVV